MRFVLQSVFVIVKDSGFPLFSFDLRVPITDPVLTSGYMGALYEFAASQLGDRKLRSVDLGHETWFYKTKHGLLFVVISSRQKTLHRGFDYLDYLAAMWFKTFNLKTEEDTAAHVAIVKWKPSTSIAFRQCVNGALESWEELEEVNVVADKRTLLELLETLLNAVMSDASNGGSEDPRRESFLDAVTTITRNWQESNGYLFGTAEQRTSAFIDTHGFDLTDLMTCTASYEALQGAAKQLLELVSRSLQEVYGVDARIVVLKRAVLVAKREYERLKDHDLL